MNVLVAVAVAEAVNVPTIVEVEVEALEFLVVDAGVVLMVDLSEIKYERSSSFLAKSFLAKIFLAKILFCFDLAFGFLGDLDMKQKKKKKKRKNQRVKENGWLCLGIEFFDFFSLIFWRLFFYFWPI